MTVTSTFLESFCSQRGYTLVYKGKSEFVLQIPRTKIRIQNLVRLGCTSISIQGLKSSLLADLDKSLTTALIKRQLPTTIPVHIVNLMWTPEKWRQETSLYINLKAIDRFNCETFGSDIDFMLQEWNSVLDTFRHGCRQIVQSLQNPVDLEKRRSLN